MFHDFVKQGDQDAINQYPDEQVGVRYGTFNEFEGDVWQIDLDDAFLLLHVFLLLG